jgi:putative membrane protein
MKTTIKLLCCLAFLGIVGTTSSCKKDNHNNYMMDDQDFVTQASSGNMFEIAAGNLAVNTSTDADVKAFGNHMITDHGQTAIEMSALANSKGWTIPSSMSQKHQNDLSTLASLSGTAFNKQFAAMMVTSHQETIDLFERAAGNTGVRDAELRGFASGKLPHLKEHLQGAQQLQTKVGQ